MPAQENQPAQTHDWPQLVAAARTGKPGAWEALLDASQLIIYSAVSGIGTREDQRDAGQDACELVLTRLHQLKEPRCYPGWLSTLARRAALRYTSGPSRAVGHGPEAAVPTPEDEIVDRVAVVPVIREAMVSLTPRQVVVVTALMHEDRPNYREVARRLQCPVGTLGPTRKRAIEQLGRTPSVLALVRDLPAAA